MRRKIILTVVAAAVTVTAVTGAVIVISWFAYEKAIHPEPAISGYELSQFDLPAEKVSFKTRDGLTLAGWFIPGERGETVILVHGKDDDRTAMLPHANYLYNAGFSILLYDSRSMGQSSGDAVTFGAGEQWDVRAAVDYLKTRSDVDHGRIGAQGLSLGATSVILAAAETEDIKGVVAEIPFKSFIGVLNHAFPEIIGLPSFPFAPVTKLIGEISLGVDFDAVDAEKVIGKISPRRVFLIDNSKDRMFPPDSVEVLFKAANEPKQWWSIDSEHGKGWDIAPDEFKLRVLDFWRQTFGTAKSEPAREQPALESR